MTNRRHQPASGFTLIELVATMVIISILAFSALPRMTGASEFQVFAFSDSVRSALRYAQKTAVSHRRLVCVSLDAQAVIMKIAPAFGATECSNGANLTSPDGTLIFASSPNPAVVLAPAETIHFQPAGTITNSAATVTDFNVTVTGAPAILVQGATGYVN